MITYESTKLLSKFSVKDKTDFKQNNIVVYHSKWSNELCKDDYIGETDSYCREN